ncbi:MAG: hypothetical protein U5N86_11510 [Planctomycetota bacterium]|nr:hypothetical protein [Planctomycetota bacterium]
MDESEKTAKSEQPTGLITTRPDSQPRLSIVEFGMVLGVFALCAAALILLFVYDRDWSKDDKKNLEATKVSDGRTVLRDAAVHG